MPPTSSAPTFASSDGARPFADRPLRFRFVKFGNIPRSTANNVVYAMEAAMARMNAPYLVAPRGNISWFLGRSLARVGGVRPICRLSDKVCFIPIGQASEGRFYPLCYLHHVVPWVFDAWPNLYDRIEKVLRRQRVRLALFTARQSADYFRQRLGIDAVWMPEACDPTVFDPSLPLSRRPVDVLELGRKYDLYHDKITPILSSRGGNHLYEKIKGQLIFGSEQDLRNGFNTAKISVCFPSSMTHPARSGDCETVTLRYFESMAARCLIIGHCPAELREIMGYDPVVAWDQADPAGQIAHILDHIDDYQALVDRNFGNLNATGSWDTRARQIIDVLAARGIRI